MRQCAGRFGANCRICATFSKLAGAQLAAGQAGQEGALLAGLEQDRDLRVVTCLIHSHHCARAKALMMDCLPGFDLDRFRCGPARRCVWMARGSHNGGFPISPQFGVKHQIVGVLTRRLVSSNRDRAAASRGMRVVLSRSGRSLCASVRDSRVRVVRSFCICSDG